MSNAAAADVADRAPKGTLRRYERLRHFDIYDGEGFERLVADQVEFLAGALLPG